MPDTLLLKSAKKLLENNFSVLPCYNHPKKSPTIATWTEYQQMPMTTATAEKHFNNGGSMGVICGAVSGNLECMDIDDPDLYQPFMETLRDINPDLADRLVKRQTPSGAYHLIYRCSSSVSGNQKLAMTEDGKVTMIETRGEGGYFLTAPSKGYTVLENSLLDVPTLAAADVDLLHSIAKSFSKKTEPTWEPQEKRTDGDGVRPGDDYNQRVDFRQLLENNGWTTKEKIGPGGEHWTRPGKEDGTSATLKDGCFYVFSSNTDLPLGSHSAFSVYAHYLHKGDFTAAAKQLAAEGYGGQATQLNNGTLSGEDTEALVIDPAAPLANAKTFCKKYYNTDAVRTLQFWQSSFYKWTGSVYIIIPPDDLRAELYRYLENCLVENKKGELEQFKPNRHRITDHLDALKAAANMAGTFVPPCFLTDTDSPPAPEMIAMANGLLHLPTRKLYNPDPSFFTTTALPFDYDPDVKEPEAWLNFLQSVWGHDKTSIDALQEICGYYLTSDTTQQKIFLFVGPKRSGKGTIARILRELLGHDNVAGPTLASLSQQFGLAGLIDKRLATISDARLGSRVDQYSIAERLLSISGEDCLNIPRKYLPDYTAKLDVKFLIMTNELPKIADDSGALASRFIVLRMTESFFGREDHGLTAKLLPEIQAIFNWSLKGLERLKEQGHFTQPESSRELIEELADLSSPISAFIRERCEVNPISEIEVSRFFLEWEDWCRTQGNNKPGNVQTLGKRLRAALPGLSKRQTGTGNDRKNLYIGITLKEFRHSKTSVSDHCTRKAKEEDNKGLFNKENHNSETRVSTNVYEIEGEI